MIDVVRESALDKKGEDFAALDVSGRTILADTFAIVTGRSKIQTRAIADAIIEAVRRRGFGVSRVEGHSEGSWILIDLGNVIVHVFTPEQRAFYNLERLWLPFVLRQAQDDTLSPARSAVLSEVRSTESKGQDDNLRQEHDDKDQADMMVRRAQGS